MIDIHHHLYPDSRDNEGRPWTVEMTLDELDRNGVAAAICGLPPVPASAPEGGAPQARVWNEWAARHCDAHRRRIGLFAALPLRDIDAALAEITHAFDVLGADGIGLPTSEGDIWLSDDRFRPVFAELDRREAVVLVHPYPTSRCRDVGLAYGGDMVSPPWLEFPVDTARVMLGLLTRGIAPDYSRVRFVFCHGGGVMPLIVGRIAGFKGWPTIGPERLEAIIPGGIYEAFARFYFDLGQAYAPESFAMLRRLVPDSHLLFGSDCPYFPIAHSVGQFGELGLDAQTASAIGGGNAARLFPRFAQGAAHV